MKNLTIYKMVLYSIFAIVLLTGTADACFAQGPVYNNPYGAGSVRGYVYNSGYGYQSAWSNAQVAGRYYVNQATVYVKQETSFTPNNTYRWIQGQGGW